MLMTKQIQILKMLFCVAVLVPLFSLSVVFNGIGYLALLMNGPVTWDYCATGSSSVHSIGSLDPLRLYSEKTVVAPTGSALGMKCPVHIEIRNFSSPLVGVLMFLVAVMVYVLLGLAVFLFFAQFEDGRAYIENWKKKVSWLSFSPSRDNRTQ